jgi:2-amino-4-hydroxy-6-hydroxymethyldihydropteridine diphosphokinase
MSRTVTAYIGVGANLGDRRATIERAVTLVDETDGIAVVKQSPLYETDPVGTEPVVPDAVGGAEQPTYLNGAVRIETTLSARRLHDELLRIEARLGRTRTVKNAPRTIDLDLLLYGDTVLDDEALTVPHARMHERWFVLKPLADIAPDVRHPVLGLTIRELLGRIETDAR